MEYDLEDILHHVVSLCYFYHVAGVCTNTGEGEGLETGRRMPRWECRARSDCDADI